MSIWITSDTHFNHKNILKYEKESRPFNTIEEMNETLIKNWNSKVASKDTVIHCGDFFMGEEKDIEPILKRLNGKIILVRGNHDSNHRLEIYKRNGIQIVDIYYINYKGVYFIFNHFPFMNQEFETMMFQDNKNICWCYGHVHSKAPKGYCKNSFHVGVDTNNLSPISLKDIRQKIKESL